MADFLYFFGASYIQFNQTFRFAILTSPGRRIELCGDAPRAPAQQPGFGGVRAQTRARFPGILAVKR